MRVPILALAALLALTACGTTAKRNEAGYNAWVELQRKDAASARADAELERDRVARDFAGMAVKCTSDACVQQVAAFKSVTEIATKAVAGGQAHAAPIPPPPRERDWAEKWRDVFSGITPLGSALASGAVAWHSSDNATKQSGQQYEFFGSAFNSMAGVANGAQPNVTVGGDYVTGSQHVGDSIAGDGNATRGSQIGDNVGGDQTGRDHNDGSVVGDENRINSPGPFDNVGNCSAGNGGNAAPGGAGGVGDGSAGAGSGAGGVGGACTPPGGG